MEDSKEVQLDESQFKLSDYGVLKITMPSASLATEEDIDAQLMAYVESAGESAGVSSLEDITDEWVSSTFEGLESVKQLRTFIRSDLEREVRRALDDMKLQRCNDELVKRVEGEIPDEVLDAVVEASHDEYMARLRQAGTNKIQYMREHDMNEEQFANMMREDIRYQMLVNIALDKMVEATGTMVPNAEITDYIACEDPEQFVKELQEKDRVEDARKVASRVKMMRRLIESVEIEPESDELEEALSKENARNSTINE